MPDTKTPLRGKRTAPEYEFALFSRNLSGEFARQRLFCTPLPEKHALAETCRNNRSRRYKSATGTHPGTGRIDQVVHGLRIFDPFDFQVAVGLVGGRIERNRSDAPIDDAIPEPDFELHIGNIEQLHRIGAAGENPLDLFEAMFGQAIRDRLRPVPIDAKKVNPNRGDQQADPPPHNGQVIRHVHVISRAHAQHDQQKTEQPGKQVAAPQGFTGVRPFDGREGGRGFAGRGFRRTRLLAVAAMA